MGFNTKPWSSMTWMIMMIWGYTHDFGNLQTHLAKDLGQHRSPGFTLGFKFAAAAIPWDRSNISARIGRRSSAKDVFKEC